MSPVMKVKCYELFQVNPVNCWQHLGCEISLFFFFYPSSVGSFTLLFVAPLAFFKQYNLTLNLLNIIQLGQVKGLMLKIFRQISQQPRRWLRNTVDVFESQKP